MIRLSRSRDSTPLDYEAFLGRIANHRTTVHHAAYFGDRRIFKLHGSAQPPKDEPDLATAMDVALADLFAT